MERLFALGCEFFIELGPGGVLAGLMQRIRKGAQVMSVSGPDSVRACAESMRIGGLICLRAGCWRLRAGEPGCDHRSGFQIR